MREDRNIYHDLYELKFFIKSDANPFSITHQSFFYDYEEKEKTEFLTHVQMPRSFYMYIRVMIYANLIGDFFFEEALINYRKGILFVPQGLILKPG